MDRLAILKQAVKSDYEYFVGPDENNPSTEGADRVSKPMSKAEEKRDEFINERIDDRTGYHENKTYAVAYVPMRIDDTHYLNKSRWTTNYCDLCGKTFKGNNITNHRKGQVHQAYEKLNNQLRHLVLNTVY